MEPFKVNVDRPKLSDEDIDKYRNFDNVLDTYRKNASSSSSSFFKTYWIWGGIGLVIIAGFVLIFSNNSIEDNKPIPSIAETTSTKKNVFDEVIEHDQPPAYKKSVTFLNKNGFKGRVKKDTKITIEQNSFVNNGPLVLNYIEKEPDENGTEFLLEVKQNQTQAGLRANKSIKYIKKVKVKGEYELGQLKDNVFVKISTQNSISTIQQNDVVNKNNSAENIKKPLKASPDNKQFSLDVLPRQFPEFEEYSNVLFEALPSEDKFDESVFDIKWGNIKLNKHDEGYEIMLQKLDSILVLQVQPVYLGEDYDKAMQKYYRAVNAQSDSVSLSQKEDFQVIFDLKQTGTYRIKNKIGS